MWGSGRKKSIALFIVVAFIFSAFGSMLATSSAPVISVSGTEMVITNPNGGESYEAGSVQTIEWASDLVSTPSVDPVGHWKLDETSGLIAYDAQGFYDGSNNGAAINQEGILDNSYYFDGNYDYVQVPNNAELDFTTGDDFSVYAWINTTAWDWGRIVEKRKWGSPTDDDTGYLMVINNNGALHVALDFYNTGCGVVSPFVVADGNWHHVGMVREGDVLEGFVDGVSIGTSTGASGDISNTNSLFIGTDRTIGFFDYTGYIDDVKIFDQAVYPDDANASAGEVDIYYSIDNGGNWLLASANESNDGSYEWTTPMVNSDQCLVKIVAIDAGNLTYDDVSDEVFTIAPISPISIITPNGGETYKASSVQTIQWTSNFNGSAMINPVSYWTLDEQSGLIAYDAQGSHHGDNHGAAINQDGMVGNSYYFDGGSDYVQVPHNAELDFTTGDDFSIYAWINTTAWDWGRIVEKRKWGSPTNDDTGYLMVINNNGALHVGLDFDSTSCAVVSPFVVADGNWHNVGMVREGDVLEGFVDGVSIGTSPGASSGDISNTNSLFIGTDRTIGYFDFTGYIDDVKIFDQAVYPYDANASAGEVDIYYSIDNGGNWLLASANESNDGSYEWTTPMVNSDQCLVKIVATDAGNLTYEDVSDEVFTILSDPATATATGPQGANHDPFITLTYTYDGSPVLVDLFYSSDDGGTWNYIGTDNTIDGLFDWIPVGNSTPKPSKYYWIANVQGGFDDVGIPINRTSPEAGPFNWKTFDLDFTMDGLFYNQNSTGWYFVSTPLEVNGDGITIFDDATWGDGGTEWDRIIWYDPSDASDHWKSYNENFPGIQDMPDVDNTMGVWIHITSNAGDNFLTIGEGVEPTSTDITLYAGWNMVGYPSQRGDMTVSEALWGTGADRVEIFDPTLPYMISEVDSDHLMQSGQAYWVHVPADTVWTVNW